ncbi:hypothetical protein [Arthrobacter sp. E3]|uniref:hypothetical protein n=1 Tax=Arthrobacter sp. E3 TaxID=517402 RepID=UPI001A94F406|nr:hypothetical protein [Arthrobacter sp. E3]
MILAVYAMVGALIASLWVSAVQLTRLLPQFAPRISELRGQLWMFLHDNLGIGDDQICSIVDSVDPRVLLDTAYNLLAAQ